MKHFFVLRVKWQSGAESVWVETVEGLDTVQQAMQYMYTRSFRTYSFTTGILSVEYVSEDEALAIEEKPLYERNPDYVDWGRIRKRVKERRDDLESSE